MTPKGISGGTVHPLPKDMRKALTSSKALLNAWEDISPLARNEWICWTISVKKEETRKDHIRRMTEELPHGKRRPCCWIGCVHRADKPMNAAQKYILGKRSKKKE
jgi:hypothetical protein